MPATGLEKLKHNQLKNQPRKEENGKSKYNPNECSNSNAAKHRLKKLQTRQGES